MMGFSLIFVLDSLADLAHPKSQLILENALLRRQLIILHRQVKCPALNRRNRFFLLVLASHVANWKQALVLLHPETLLRWHREGCHLFWKHKSRPKAPQPKIAQETIELIQWMAKQNLLWGAERFQGELFKLGIQVAKRTIQKYMRPVRATSPRGQTWATFLKNHARDIWACDFLPVVDLLFRPLFLFFIIGLGSRRVVYFGVTRHPTEVWAAQQLRAAGLSRSPLGSQRAAVVSGHQRIRERLQSDAASLGVATFASSDRPQSLAASLTN